MSVPLHIALVTVIAEELVELAVFIINLFVLRTTVSSQLVNALMADWTLVATRAIVVSVLKFNPVRVLAVPLIVIAKLQSVTAFHVATTLVAFVQPVRKAGV